MSRVCRVVAGIVAGVLAFAASPAFAQEKPGQADKVKELETELAKLRAMEAELEGQLKKLGIQADVKRIVELADVRSKLAEIEKATKLKDAQAKLKTAQTKPGVKLFVPDTKGAVPYEQMSAEQLKDLIAKLQGLLEEKTRNPEKVKPGSTAKVKPGGEKKPGAGSQDEIMKRLDQLSKEIEELRRAIKK
jgi:hypothetical protein